jgi:hypothetical protein
MGFHAKDIGFRSAVEMVRYMEKGGLVAQIEIMVRMIKSITLSGSSIREDGLHSPKRITAPAIERISMIRS